LFILGGVVVVVVVVDEVTVSDRVIGLRTVVCNLPDIFEFVGVGVYIISGLMS
jgi:hypothetical protein